MTDRKRLKLFNTLKSRQAKTTLDKFVLRSFKEDEMLDINDLVGKIHLGDCLDIMKQMPALRV
jgi:hypothetical protein